MQNVIDVFLGLLLEKKILLISAHNALLSHASAALLNMLYPFSWSNVIISVTFLPNS